MTGDVCSRSIGNIGAGGTTNPTLRARTNIRPSGPSYTPRDLWVIRFTRANIHSAEICPPPFILVCPLNNRVFGCRNSLSHTPATA
eukprot:1288875-Prymnesium_polylepis.1